MNLRRGASRIAVGMRVMLLAALAAGLTVGAPSAQAARKALVIGNDAYSAFRPLHNAIQDARDVAEALRKAGFEVPAKWQVLDGTRRQMDSALQDFVGNLSSEDEVVFYYSGHGVEIDGQAALLPVDLSDPTRRPLDGSLRALDEVDQAKRQVLHESITFNRIAADIASRRVKFSLLIADACRDNPVLELLKRAHQASPLKNAQAPPMAGIIADRLSDTQVFVFSARRGQQSLDKLGESDPVRNSVFTRVLLDKMTTPGLSLRVLLRGVTSEVEALAATYRPGGHAHVQQPVTLAAYTAPDFYFISPGDDPHPLRPDFSDLDRRQQWQNWQSSMQADFDRAAGYQLPSLAVEAWDRFLTTYAQDNPYSDQDERLRRDAGERKARAEQQLAGGRDESITGRMLRIEPGCFMMGSPASEAGRERDERQHRVCVDGFEIGQFEVTQRQWQTLMSSNPSRIECEDCPVEQVSWHDVMAYIEKLNARAGGGFRLPTEAEWEYAARAGTTTPFHTGERISTSQANFNGTSIYNGSAKGVFRNKTTSVGSFGANAWGLHDVHGNVGEWTCSGYDSGYSGGELRCAEGASKYVVRGGCWLCFPRATRLANRDRNLPTYRSSLTGLRLARTLP